MEGLKTKNILMKILMLCIIFTFTFILKTTVFSYTISNAQRQAMEIEIKNWLNSSVQQTNVQKYVYNDPNTGEEVTYAIVMPKPTGNIKYNGNSGTYYYELKDNNNNVIGSIPFDIYTPVSTGETFGEKITQDNVYSYAQTQDSFIYETDDDQLLKIINIEDETPRQITLAAKLDDGTFISADSAHTFDFTGKPVDLLEAFWNWVKEVGGNFVEWLLDQITPILNDVFIWIADGISNLIDLIFGADQLTIDKIVFGKVEKLSINFWPDAIPATSSGDADSGLIVGNAPATTLKPIVEYWYKTLNGIVIAVYIVMLLYIAVRILLASTGQAQKKYKEMLMGWLTGVAIIAFYPYVMKYTVILNNSLVQMIEEGRNNVADSTDDTYDTMQEIRNLAEENDSIPMTIVYIIMLGQLIVLLAVYYKRVFMLCFLITIFPVVSGLYVWEKTKGAARALSNWTKEYVILVFVQSFHAAIYIVLVEGALQAFISSKNWLLFVLSVTFLFEGEKIIRAIFGQKSSANTIGELAATGAAALAATKGVKQLWQKNKKNKEEDSLEESQEKDAEKTIREAQRRNTVNKTMSESTTVKGLSGIDGDKESDEPKAPPEPEDQMENLEAAKALITKEALSKRRKRGFISKATGAVTSGVARAAGVTLGVTSGLAQGSMAEGLKNAVVANELVGIPLSIGKSIVGFATGIFSGKRMKAKIRCGAMDDKLREVGFDLDGYLHDETFSSDVKAQIIRNALAAKLDAERRGGKAAGDLAFVREMRKGSKARTKQEQESLN